MMMGTAKHVCIAVPAYTWTVFIPTMRSIITDLLTLTQRGDRVTILDESGSTDLPDARAVNVAKFMECGGTHLVSIDNDVCWEAGALVRLIDYPVDMVAGVYPKRQDPIEFPLTFPDEATELWADPDTGLLEAKEVQGGFVRFTRAVFEQMFAAYPDLQFRSTRYGSDAPLYALFEPMFVDGRRKGEDFAFCRRWRAIGGKVWVDPEIRMAHIGNKAFIGSLGDWLRNR